jgi:predicted nucleic acid-binding protein
MQPCPLVVLDANVLYPFQLRNFLLHAAAEELFVPLWSDTIVDEFARNLRKRHGISQAKVDHLVNQMRAAFPDAWGAGYEGAADGVPLPDEGDRHVVELAVKYEAEAIVTNNIKDFPERALAPFQLSAISPEEFADILADFDPRAIFMVAENHRLSLKRAPLSPAEYLESLEVRAGMPCLADRLRTMGFDRRERPIAP